MIFFGKLKQSSKLMKKSVKEINFAGLLVNELASNPAKLISLTDFFINLELCFNLPKNIIYQ
jgi:hypothetical protein